MNCWPGRLGLALAACAWSAAAIAQQAAVDQAASDEPAKKEQIDAALKLTTEAAHKYEITLADASRTPAKLIAEPVLRWSNPAVGEVHGNVFLWAANSEKTPGRPVAVGSLFKWFSPHSHSSHEFQSLTESKLVAKYDDRQVWTTQGPGVKFVPFEAEPPASGATRRLAQLRSLAKRFTGSETTREGVQHELRLLTQPIYHYAAPEEEVLAGGLFAFVQGTDPDVLLLIEARGAKEPHWHFAAARMQNCALSVQLDGRQAWSAEQLEWNVAFDHTQPYTLFDTPGK